MLMKLDIHFIEFYIFKKYNQKLEEYYSVNKFVLSGGIIIFLKED